LIKPGYNLSRNKPMRLTLRRPTIPMQLTIQYDVPSELPHGGNPIIGRYIIPNVPVINNQDEVELRFKFKHDHNGITNLLKAEAVEVKETFVDVPENEVKNEEKDKMETENKGNETETKEENKTNNETNNENKMDEENQPKGEESPKTVKKKKTQTIYHPLEIVRHTAGLSQGQIKQFLELEERFIKEDSYVAEVAYTKNALESYIYDSRAKLSESWNDFSSEQEKSDFTNLLTKSYEWFETEGSEDQSLNAYKSKLDPLLAFGNKFQKRLVEFEERPSAIETLLTTIEECKAKAIASLKEEAYAHIEREKLESITIECERVFNMTNEKLGEQNSLRKSDDPVILSGDLRERAKNLTKFCEDILNTPKPKPKEEKKETPKTPKTNENKETKEEKKEEKDTMETEGNQTTTTNDNNENMETDV